ncbi:MAG: hypothetical protein COS96_00210 [Candidatus Nealsonbacteria bacterium CG07_land_8_20_14_0_80_39_13]|nr:MAG: hypothetical protein COS96_00210 [Candidatus Nealsonbacteria bacterium CG07_land_8_20_14_0_80_39_13]
MKFSLVNINLLISVDSFFIWGFVLKYKYSVKRKAKNAKQQFKFQNRLKKRAYFYALDVIKFIDILNKKDFSVNIITRQLLRSATSIGANIIEAQAGSTRKDFTNFFSYSLKSANESKF